MTHRLRRAPSLVLVALLAALAVFASGLGSAPKAFAGTAPAASVTTNVAANPAADSPAPNATTSTAEVFGPPAKLWPNGPAAEAFKPKALAITPTAAAAVTEANCLRKPPAAVKFGPDQARWCYTASGAIWANPMLPGTGYMFSHKPNKSRLFASTTDMQWLFGEFCGLDTAGKLVCRDMVFSYGTKVADVAGLDPNAPINQGKYNGAGLKPRYGWFAKSPTSFNKKAGWIGVWAPGHMWRKPNPAKKVYETSWVPILSAVHSASGYCSVTAHLVVNSAYPNAVAKVLRVDRAGKKTPFTLKRADSLYFHSSVPVKCASTKAGAIARVLGGSMASS